jgi:hypothetical protein
MPGKSRTSVKLKSTNGFFRRNGFKVSSTAYFVFVNGQRNADAFDWELKFEPTIVPYVGDDGWVQHTVMDAYACLNANALPPSGEDCDACAYYRQRSLDERVPEPNSA